MYHMFSKQNLRDQWARQQITVPDGVNIDVLINLENQEYEERQTTRIGTVADSDKENEAAEGDACEDVNGNINEELDSSAEGSCYGFSEKDKKEFEDESSLFTEYMFWKEIDMEKRKKLKEIPRKPDVEYWNNRMANIIQREEQWSLWEIDCIIYAAMTKILKKCRKECIQKEKKGKGKKKVDDNKDVRKDEIVNLRKMISWISDIVKARAEGKKLTHKQFNNLRKIKEKYRISKSKKLKVMLETLKQRVKVLAARIKRAAISERFKAENETFRKSPGNWLSEKLGGKTEENEKYPAINEITDFWKQIWGNDTSHKEVSEQWENWEEEFKQTVKITKRPVDNPFVTFGLMKKVIKKMKPWKAAGWDQISPYYWQKLDSVHKVLHGAINRSFENSTCEEWETLGRTILFPKKGKDASKPESYRPITCLLIIYKIRSALIANRLNKHIHDNNLWPFEQFGTLGRTQGSKEALLLDSMIAEEVRLYKRNIFMVWTDVKKAYDSIQQHYIIRMLELIEAPSWIINWIKQAMKSWRTKLQMMFKDGMKVTDVIRILCGIFQGDSLSPLLFCISYLMVSVILRRMRIGYVPGPPGERDMHQMRSHFILMDDFKGLTSTESCLRIIINTSTEILKEIGLEIGYNKCAVMKAVKGKVVSMEGIDISIGGIIDSIDNDSNYAYLGILELLDPCHVEVKREIVTRVEKLANIVWGSELNEKNKVDAHNMLVVSKLTYTFGIIKWTQNELDEIDRMLRKCLSKNGCLSIHSNTKRLYLTRKNGGRGLLNVHHLHNRVIVSLVGYIFNANSEHAKLIKKFWMNKRMGTLLKKAEDIIEDAGLNLAFTVNGIEKDGDILNHRKLGYLLKKEYQKQYASWVDTELHGRILTRCIEEGVNVMDSFKWLSTAGLKGAAVSTVFAIQEQAIPTKVIKKRIWKNSSITSENCRMCGKHLETVAHIISGCTVLANNLYKTRHDNVVRVVYYYLLFKLGFTDTWHPWYDTALVEAVKENEECTIYWDYPMQTNNTMKFNKPDITIIYKSSDKIVLVEGSVPWDENLAAKVIEKRNKYVPLAIELKNLHQKTYCAISELVIGSTGLMDNSFRKALGNLCDNTKDSNMIIDYCQKAAILGTVRICRQLFDGVV